MSDVSETSPAAQPPAAQQPAVQQPAVQPPAAPQADWLPAELKGRFESPDQLAAAYVGLEKRLSAPPDKLLVLPDDDAQKAELAAKLLGVPAPDQYKIEGLPDDDAAKWFVGQAAELRLPPTAAKTLYDRYQARLADAQKAAEAKRAEEASATRAALEAAWGSATPQRIEEARSAVKMLDRVLEVAGYKGPPLGEVLDTAGLSNNEAIVRMFAEVAKLARTGPDSVAGTVGRLGPAGDAVGLGRIEELTRKAVELSGRDRLAARRLMEEAARLRAMVQS